MSVSGRCLCGGVRFEIDEPLRGIVVCHCSLCRRAGSNAAAYTRAPRQALRLSESGTLSVYVDVSGRERSFCSACGASLFWAASDDVEISISVGALDGRTGLRVLRHIYVDSAADWEQLPRDATLHRAGSASPLATGDGE